jgi:cysteine desulfurase
MTPIYLDHNATSPLDPAVLEAMRPFWLAGGNPDSRHAAGRAARRAFDAAKANVAHALGASPDEVVFTSGGTEANNLAIFGHFRETDRGRLLTSPIEHPAVAEPVAVLERRGVHVDRLPVGPDGVVDLSTAQTLLSPGDPSVRLATLMLAHNETGALQPVAELARIAAESGVPTHTDAVQAVGRIDVDFHALGVATLAASAHKFGGPVGVGVLLVRSGTALDPLLRGGGQQGGRRPGTIPVALAVGMAEALALWQRESQARQSRWRHQRARLESALRTALGNQIQIHGPRDPERHLPQTLHVGFPGRDGNALLMQLDLAGVQASLGAACASGAATASPTLRAMGVPDEIARASVRFSLGASTTDADIDTACQRLVAILRPTADVEND